MKLRLLLAIPLILALRACSYGHGVDRMLTFDNDIKDFSCITTALENLGYDIVEDTHYGASYYSDEIKRSASFWYTYIDAGHNGGPDRKKITHSIGFGSTPESCSDVKSAGEFITQVEVKVLASCKLEPINTEEEIRCDKQA